MASISFASVSSDETGRRKEERKERRRRRWKAEAAWEVKPEGGGRSMAESSEQEKVALGRCSLIFDRKICSDLCGLSGALQRENGKRRRRRRALEGNNSQRENALTLSGRRLAYGNKLTDSNTIKILNKFDTIQLKLQDEICLTFHGKKITGSQLAWYNSLGITVN